MRRIRLFFDRVAGYFSAPPKGMSRKDWRAIQHFYRTDPRVQAWHNMAGPLKKEYSQQELDDVKGAIDKEKNLEEEHILRFHKAVDDAFKEDEV